MQPILSKYQQKIDSKTISTTHPMLDQWTNSDRIDVTKVADSQPYPNRDTKYTKASKETTDDN